MQDGDGWDLDTQCAYCDDADEVAALEQERDEYKVGIERVYEAGRDVVNREAELARLREAIRENVDRIEAMIGFTHDREVQEWLGPALYRFRALADKGEIVSDGIERTPTPEWALRNMTEEERAAHRRMKERLFSAQTRLETIRALLSDKEREAIEYSVAMAEDEGSDDTAATLRNLLGDE
jgi:hypothetical protein